MLGLCSKIIILRKKLQQQTQMKWDKSLSVIEALNEQLLEKMLMNS